jgi:hypothetical protein
LLSLSQIYWVQPQPAVLAVLKKAGILEASGGGKSRFAFGRSSYDEKLIQVKSLPDEHLQPSVSKALEVVEERMKDVSRRQGEGDRGEERNRAGGSEEENV